MKYYVYTLLLLSLTATNTFAQSPEERGLEIAKEIDKRDSGWLNAETNLKMVLRNREGDESTRSIRVKMLEITNDGDKSLTIFDTPADIKGTAFLSYSHAIEPDDQWLYLPSLKRVKRVASSNKSGPFMGSEFAYEDLASFEVEKYQYKFLREELLEGRETLVIESRPLYKYSGYTRLVAWIDKDRYIPIKTQYYDRKNDLLKTLNFKNYKQYLNQYWRAHEQIMTNHQSGKITELTLSEYRFRIGLNDQDFNRKKLQHIR